ncbi:MAG: hypothetical protein ACXW2W_05460 [Telluria sp.]
MNFLFRKPRLPIIVDTRTRLFAAKSWTAYEKQLKTITFADLAPRDVIDANAEAFSLYPERIAVSPLTFKKRWTKMDIIEFHNSSKGPGRPEYPTTSLGNKSLGEDGHGHRGATDHVEVAPRKQKFQDKSFI